MGLALCAMLAGAAEPGAVRKQVESSLLVTGTVDIERDGSVGGFALDRREKLPDFVTGLVDGAVPLWKFEPVVVEGKPVAARTRMSLRVVAKKQEDGNFLVDIRNAAFGGVTDKAARDVSAKSMAPPKFSETAYRMGVKGTVYVIVRILPDGTVEDAFVEQVNLTVVGNEREMVKGRDLLGKSTVAAAKGWTFNVPAEPADDAEFWLVRVPVAYAWSDERVSQYGDWETYVPGPTAKAPWALEEIDASFSPDAQIAGSVQQVGSGPRLLTRLTGS